MNSADMKNYMHNICTLTHNFLNIILKEEFLESMCIHLE